MLDREYEQHLQSSGNAVVDKSSDHLLWVIIASSIIVPTIIYLSKIAS